MQEDLLNELKEIGFNAYEAKVYLSLLKNHPATGYEVSKDSSVPQARAYDTLKALENRQVVVAIGTKPVTYVPVSPKELLNRFERSYKTSIDYLRENLPSLSEDFDEPVHNLRGSNSIFHCAVDLINQAKKEIFLEVWSEDLDKLKDPLLKAYKRGVDVKIVGYNDVQLDFGKVYQHGLGPAIENSLGGRWLILSVDGAEGIVGTISQAVWTRNRGIVLIIKEVIVHDIFMLEIRSDLRDEITKAYGEDYVRLRERVLGNEFILGK